jgi:hypothetical protein
MQERRWKHEFLAAMHCFSGWINNAIVTLIPAETWSNDSHKHVAGQQTQAVHPALMLASPSDFGRQEMRMCLSISDLKATLRFPLISDHPCLLKTLPARNASGGFATICNQQRESNLVTEIL